MHMLSTSARYLIRVSGTLGKVKLNWIHQGRTATGALGLVNQEIVDEIDGRGPWNNREYLAKGMTKATHIDHFAQYRQYGQKEPLLLAKETGAFCPTAAQRQ